MGEDVESVMERLSRGMSRLLRPHRIDRSTQTLKDPMVWETEKLAFDIVFFTTGKRSCKPSKSIELIFYIMSASFAKTGGAVLLVKMFPIITMYFMMKK